MFAVIFATLCVSHVNAIDCGTFYPPTQRSDDMIISGYTAYAGLFPWMVSLQIKTSQNAYQHVCGGAIISEDWLLTAAHCVEDPDSQIEQVNAGSLIWDYPVSLHTPEKIIIHSSSRLTSDIALVKVTPPFLFKEGENGEGAVTPVCLPTDEQQFVGRVTLSGWGATNVNLSDFSNGTYPRELFGVNVPILEDLVCHQYSNFFSPGPYICTGPSERRKQKGGCYGDAGGPSVGIINQKAYLVGILSGANGQMQCATIENPLLYSKVSTFRKWIRINTGV